MPEKLNSLPYPDYIKNLIGLMLKDNADERLNSE